jgi:FAD dependent oxidoreductase.
VLEKQIAGFGASGRNGGWCSALFPRSTASLVRAHGRDAALAMRSAMVATVDEVGRAASEAGVDADYVKGGTIAYARSAVQLAAARAEVDEAGEYGVDAVEFWDSDREAGHRIGGRCPRGNIRSRLRARASCQAGARMAAAVERAGCDDRRADRGGRVGDPAASPPAGEPLPPTASCSPQRATAPR